MTPVVLVISLLIGFIDQSKSATVHHVAPHVATHHPHPPTTTVDPILSDLDHLKQSVESITRQMMTQNLFVEERIRSDGDSGYKVGRKHSYGTKSYTAERNLAAFSDVPYHKRHLVFKESGIVMNGVDFKMAWNRYNLQMPSTKSKAFHALEDIPFPEVPQSVLSKTNVTEQIKEMAAYFKAFRLQDTKIRNYKNYFKPVICYLEGAWLDRSPNIPHYLLNTPSQTAFTDYSGIGTFIGAPNYDPVKLFDVINGTAHYAHWNHRIVCHPIRTDIRLIDFILVDDLAPRLGQMKSPYDFSKSKTARFRLATSSGYNFNSDRGYALERNKNIGYTKLDKVMEEIPGKDNYPAKLTDNSFDLLKYRGDMSNYTVLNTGYYHRWFKVNKKGAMGTTRNYRGFADENLWTAKTTQPRVAEMSATDCVYNRSVHRKVCTDYTARYTYAIPLEIVWLTPLLTWNPYNLNIYHGNVWKSPANIVNSNGRNGGHNTSTAFNGVNDENYYLTPPEFFAAHLPKKGVLDKHGKMQLVSPSGLQTILPAIKDVGEVRLRYPIMPFHHEGNAVYKQVDALKEIIMNMARNAHIFDQPPPYLYVSGEDQTHAAYQEHFRTTRSTSTSIPSHLHDIYINWEQHLTIHNHSIVHAYTSLNEGHMHEIEFHMRPGHPNQYEMVKCDGSNHCFDGHSNTVYHLRI